MEEKHQGNVDGSHKNSSYQSSLLSLEIEQHMADVEIMADVHDTKEQIQEKSLPREGDLDLLFEVPELDMKDLEESNEIIDRKEKTSVIDFLLEKNGDEEYLGNEILDQEQQQRLIFNPDIFFETHNDEISRSLL